MLINYEILSYNNSTHSSLNYIPFQLNYRNPLELNQDKIITNYMQKHIENIQTINEQMHKVLLSKQKKN